MVNAWGIAIRPQGAGGHFFPDEAVPGGPAFDAGEEDSLKPCSVHCE